MFIGLNVIAGVSTSVSEDDNSLMAPVVMEDFLNQDDKYFFGRVFNVKHSDGSIGGENRYVYNRIIKIPINQEEGLAIKEAAEKIRTDEYYFYNFLKNNCGQFVQEVLAAADKDFISPNDWIKYTRPNSAIKYIKKMIEKNSELTEGWEYYEK